MSEAEAQRKKKPQKLVTKKMQAVLEETSGKEPETVANDFKIDYKPGQEMPEEGSAGVGNNGNWTKCQARTGERENSRSAQRL